MRKMPNLIPDAVALEGDLLGDTGDNGKVDVNAELEKAFSDGDEDIEDDGDFTIPGLEDEREDTEEHEDEIPAAEVGQTEREKALESRAAALEAREAAIQAAEVKLGTARKIENLLQYEEFRNPIAEMLKKASEPGFNWGSKDGESARKLMNGFRDERVDEILGALPALQQAAELVQTAQARSDLDSTRAGFEKKFGDVVTDEVWDGIEKSAAKKYGRALNLDHIRLEAFEVLSGEGAQAARMKKEMESQPKGTRIVTGTGSRKQVREPDLDPLKLSQQQRQALIAKAL
jgi:hypothetical protein